MCLSDSFSSWTSLSMGVPSRTSAPTPALDQNLNDLKIILGKVRSFTSPSRGPSTGSDHCSLLGQHKHSRLPLLGAGTACAAPPLTSVAQRWGAAPHRRSLRQ